MILDSSHYSNGKWNVAWFSYLRFSAHPMCKMFHFRSINGGESGRTNRCSVFLHVTSSFLLREMTQMFHCEFIASMWWNLDSIFQPPTSKFEKSLPFMEHSTTVSRRSDFSTYHIQIVCFHILSFDFSLECSSREHHLYLLSYLLAGKSLPANS